ncbi:hypothetical protein DFH06DRAFT_1150906 [Mycena polygramma]|nr:hypothetical protein DFH06DRAFT_1150906 [Mycena polygramma]
MALPGIGGSCFVPGAWLRFQEAYPYRMMKPKPDRYTGYQACDARVYAPVSWSPSAVDRCVHVAGGVRDGVYLDKNYEACKCALMPHTNDKEEADYTMQFPGQEAISYGTIDAALAHHTIECQGGTLFVASGT